MSQLASETSLSSLVSDNSSQKQLKNLRLQDEQNNELKALINLKSKQTLLVFTNWCINCVLMRVMERRERDNS